MKEKNIFSALPTKSDDGVGDTRLFSVAGISDSCSRLGRFYSMPSVRVYFSSGRYMSIRFFTDGSVTNTGFRLKYKAIPASG